MIVIAIIRNAMLLVVYGYMPREEVGTMDRHYSAGGVARELGVSVSLLDKLEKQELIPRAPRFEGSGRKVFSPCDVEIIRDVVEERRRARVGQLTAPSAA